MTDEKQQEALCRFVGPDKPQAAPAHPQEGQR